MARKFSIADICFYPTLFENKNKGTMPLAQFYFHSLEAHDSAFYTPRRFGWCYQELIKDLKITNNVAKRGLHFVDW